jgi:hypothetical protein
MGTFVTVTVIQWGKMKKEEIKKGENRNGEWYLIGPIRDG